MNEDQEEAAMRAMFGDAQRPPMGDEAFVQGVMARVEQEKVVVTARRNGMAVGLMALVGALLWPFRDPLQVAMRGAVEQAAVGLPSLSAGALALLVAAAVSGAAWLYAERG